MTRPLRSTDPTRIGDYELTGRIGGGGMGDVFLGRSPGGRLAAVKVVRDLLADDPQFRERFRREVAAARSVSGAYTAAVLDADPDAERPWLATAYIDGPSLFERVADEGPLSAQETRALGAGLAEALRDIHRAGLVHRDLKPGNVLLASDGPRLIDFGIIRTADGSGPLTETGYVLGSAGYMAPEQVSGGEADSAADVYSLGAVLTFAVTGHGPFGDGPTPNVLLRQASGDRDISDVPEGLRDVVARCLDILPGARPTTDALLELLGGNAIEGNAIGGNAIEPPKKPKAAKATGAKSAKATKTAKTAKSTKTTPKPAKSVAKTATIKATKTTKTATHASREPVPTRRKVLLLGLAGAAVAAFSVGVADMPHGDSKTTGAEGTDHTSDGVGARLPTVAVPGRLSGPLKKPLWSHTGTYADFLGLSGNTLLVQGTALTAYDPLSGLQRWIVPTGKFGQLDDGLLPTTADTVYETTADTGDLAAVSVANGDQSWTAPGPDSWLTRGLLGASKDLVVAWSFIETDPKQPDNGIWAVDPHTHRQLWHTPIGDLDGTPYYSPDSGLVLVSQPEQATLTAYDGRTGLLAWTAKDTSQSSYPANATGITGHGANLYWAANRLYAYDKSGRSLWPMGVGDGDDIGYHAVIADDDTVYAAVSHTMGDEAIAAYKASDGAPLWRSAWPPDTYLDPSLECGLALGGGNLYITDHTSGTLIALDAKTGDPRWQFHDPAATDKQWQVVANDDYVFIGYGTTVHAFTAK